MASTDETERQPLLRATPSPSLGVERGGYGAAEQCAVNRTVGSTRALASGAASSGEVQSDGSLIRDSIPYLIINPGKVVKPPSDVDVSTSTTTTLFESGEARFRLRRRELASEGAPSTGRELSNRRTRSSTSSQSVSVKWQSLHVHLEHSPTWRERLGTDDHETEHTDSMESGEVATAKRLGKVVLSNVSGAVAPGQLLAIMGASGAGKTTLLNVLAGRNAHGLDVNGEISLNGTSATPDFVCSVSGYIQQEDLFISTLTVREHLAFHALLRMAPSKSDEQRLARVQEVLQEVGLGEVADSTIGDPIRIRGISGGERKRLSFASEVLTDPPLLFVDEPTSGLDSYMAESVVNTLQNLALSGRTILSTIHQPASEVYAMFDRVMLLAEGRTAFLGTTGDALAHFRNQGHDCPANFNPADFFIHSLAIVPQKEDECRGRVKAIADAFEESPYASASQVYGQRDDCDTALVGRKRESWCKQMGVIMQRSWLSFVRDPGLIRVRSIQTVFTALLAGIVYLRMSNDQARVQNSIGIIFFMVTNQVFNPLFSVLQVFPLELPLFLRDVQNRMYATNVYFICKTITELPFNILNAAVYTSVVYWMVGLNPDPERFAYCLLMITLVTLCAISLSYFVSAISSTIQVAMAIAPMMLMPFLLFGGLFIRVDSLPVYLAWITKISFINYAFEGLVINEWLDRPVGHTENERVVFANGTEVIQSYGFNASMDEAWWDIYKTIIWAVVVRILAYIMLELRVWRTNRR